MASFKDRLEAALKMRRLSAADLAKASGVGEGAISQYRKGAYAASQRNLEKIAAALCVPIPWLMGISDELPADVPSAKQGRGLSPEDEALLYAYHHATPDDRAIIDNIVQRYLPRANGSVEKTG